MCYYLQVFLFIILADIWRSRGWSLDDSRTFHERSQDTEVIPNEFYALPSSSPARDGLAKSRHPGPRPRPRHSLLAGSIRTHITFLLALMVR